MVFLFQKPKTKGPAPATHGRPMLRATTAAWLVMPPRVVSTPVEIAANDVFHKDDIEAVSSVSYSFFAILVAYLDRFFSNLLVLQNKNPHSNWFVLTFCCVHSMDVIWAGLVSHEDDLLSVVETLHSLKGKMHRSLSKSFKKQTVLNL